MTRQHLRKKILENLRANARRAGEPRRGHEEKRPRTVTLYA